MKARSSTSKAPRNLTKQQHSAAPDRESSGPGRAGCDRQRTLLRGQGARSSREGSALVLALAVVVVLSGLGAAFLVVTRSASQRQGAETQDLQAFYLAEAGLAESFQALRIGRSGQVGSETEPAEFGDGLLWVDATETADDQVRLTSTALHGTGRASLALIVEPVEIPLGFFSDEDLVVDEVLLLDGFNSEEATYEATVGDGTGELQAYAAGIAATIGRSTLIGFLTTAGQVTKQTVANSTTLDAVEATELVARLPEMSAAYEAGTLFPPPADSDLAASGMTSVTTTPSQITDVHTESGGLLSSNGNVFLATAPGAPVEIYGDVRPGPNGTLSVGDALVTGSTAERTTAVVLPEVVVPTVALAAAVRHDGLLPLIVSPGTSGHERIEVAADAELILRGPATIVIGDLVLEPGALLTLDTRDGDVALYITGGMDLQAGSTVTTTSELPDELSIQVDAIPTGAGGAPVKLEASSQFHGTIYAPETEVYVGTNFEVYGGIVARKLDIGPGALLHFDSAKYDGSPVPRLVSWRIMEIPAALRSQRGDPFALLGVAPNTGPQLADAHDLSGVTLTLDYVDKSNFERSFSGLEADFDWTLVASVLDVQRDTDRTKEDPGTTGGSEPSTTTPSDQALLDSIADTSLTSSEVAAELTSATTVSDTVLIEAMKRTPAMDVWDLYDVMLALGPPATGFPGAMGDRPLSDTVLLQSINDSPLPSKELSWVLEQNSPLSSGVLDALQNRSPAMPRSDLNTVLRAQ